MFWNRYPIARILLPFLSGICATIYFGLSFLLPVYVFIILLLAMSAIVFLFQKKLSYKLRWLTGFIITVFYMLAGYQLTAIKNNANNINFFGQHISGENYTLATLCEPVQVKEKVCKCVVEIIAVNDSSGWQQTSGKAIVYIEKDSLSENLNYGDEIFIKTNFSEVSPPSNPGEYNYKNYLKYRSVDYNAYVKKTNWKFISSGNGNFLVSFAFKLRNKLLQILKNEGLQGNEYAVVSALLIGSTDKLDPELIKDYQGSGAVHILSVSGLHVGIIFIVLNFLLLFFDKIKYGRIPKAFLLLSFIWFYAILTGLSPSVMRSAAMISFVVIGNAFRQTPNIYNTLAASAFVLLIYDPYMITEVGFQLSYLAVLGIVVVYPYINKAWTPRFWLVRKIWSLVAVSIAAQMITFPLCIFYFHQFPNYFLLTNIIAVPLSGLIIYLGIATLLLSFVPWLSVILAKALSYSLILLNGSISFIEGMPYSVSRAFSVNITEMLIIYAILIAFFIFLLHRKNKVFIGATAFLLLFLISFTIKNQKAVKQQKIIVYQINKHTAIDFIDGYRSYFVCDSAFAQDNQKQQFHIFNNRYKLKTHEVLPFIIGQHDEYTGNNIFYKKENFYGFAGKKFAIIDKATFNTKRMSIDFLLISNNPDITIKELLVQYKPILFIFDASNSEKNIEKWTKQCEYMGISYYSTRHSGAWEYVF